MTIIVEDGTVVAGAESYATVAYADTYHSNFGNSAWASLITATKEQYLRRATQYMLQRYRKQWNGYRKDAVQVLDWPRSFVYTQPFVHGAVGAYPFLVSDIIVPEEVKVACVELALKASTATLMPDTTQQIKREKIGPIETEYSEFSQQSPQFRAIDALLSIYLRDSGISVALTR